MTSSIDRLPEGQLAFYLVLHADVGKSLPSQVVSGRSFWGIKWLHPKSKCRSLGWTMVLEGTMLHHASIIYDQTTYFGWSKSRRCLLRLGPRRPRSLLNLAETWQDQGCQCVSCRRLPSLSPSDHDLLSLYSGFGIFNTIYNYLLLFGGIMDVWFSCVQCGPQLPHAATIYSSFNHQAWGKLFRPIIFSELGPNQSSCWGSTL